MYELLDHYLGLPKTDWVAKYRAEKQRKVSEALAALKARTAKSEGAGPSLPIVRYAGTYQDPWYGNIDVAVVEGRLRIDFKSTPRMCGVLEHWQYDTFVTVIAAAAVGIWSLWRISGLQASRWIWIRNGALAAALLGIVWIGFAGKLFSFNLNY